MKLFISWSGEASKVAALALKSFVSNVIQSVDAFVSDTDIDSGSKWADVITSELNATSFGILCITPENLEAPWIMFEAGCLSKGIDDRNRVIPLLFKTAPSDLRGPLTIFNASKPGEADIFEIIRSINKQCDKPLEIDRLADIFNKWWPDLDNKFKEVAEILSTTHSDDEQPALSHEQLILEEILSLSRKTSNAMFTLEGKLEAIASSPELPRKLGLQGMAPIPALRSEKLKRRLIASKGLTLNETGDKRASALPQVRPLAESASYAIENHEAAPEDEV